MSRNISVQEKSQVVNVTEAVTYSRRGKVYEATLHGAKVAEADTRSQAEFCLIEAASPRLAGMIRVVRRRAGGGQRRERQRWSECGEDLPDPRRQDDAARKAR